MHAFHNIEKSAFNRGEYVGYAAGSVWRIKKTNSTYGNWIAICRDDPTIPHIYTFRLADMSPKLAATESFFRDRLAKAIA